MHQAIELLIKKIEAKEERMIKYWDANSMERYRTLDTEVDALKEFLTALKIAENSTNYQQYKQGI